METSDTAGRRNKTIVVCEPDAATQLAPQYNHLMSERGILCLKPQLRLEWRGQDGQNETEQPDHATRLGDSVTSSTRMRFSAHTGKDRIDGNQRYSWTKNQ